MHTSTASAYEYQATAELRGDRIYLDVEPTDVDPSPVASPHSCYRCVLFMAIAWLFITAQVWHSGSSSTAESIFSLHYSYSTVSQIICTACRRSTFNSFQRFLLPYEIPYRCFCIHYCTRITITRFIHTAVLVVSYDDHLFGWLEIDMRLARRGLPPVGRLAIAREA